MNAARASNKEEDPPIPGAPVWLNLAFRHVPTAGIAILVLFMLGKQLDAYPSRIDALAEKLSAAVEKSGDRQVQALRDGLEEIKRQLAAARK